eukprot:TRINITY_DN22700_c0_g1_i1.p1 TRINITY_DN22700_c0_g1~~TRINITY_DN22700_c0_g1_i1.p1  ORF type:complete len:541 (+),score=85.44 TRINITY_DN22700_c0_g1_i1:1452-3074(+)
MVRRCFQVAPGRRFQYELLPPPHFDASSPTTFIVSVSGTGGQHVNGFSKRLPSPNWVVAVPLRPKDAPLFFEGSGAEGDGLWHLREFCRHLLEIYAVDCGRFIFVGVSNGGNAVLRFALRWPELCRGLLVVTTGVSGQNEDLSRLQGLPLDLYVGTKDECGFYQPMLSLEAALRSSGQQPPASLTIFEDAGHCCSPLVDMDLVHARILLMCLHSRPAGKKLVLRPPEPGLLTQEEIVTRLGRFCEDLGLRYEVDVNNRITARHTEAKTSSDCTSPSLASTSASTSSSPARSSPGASPSSDSQSIASAGTVPNIFLVRNIRARRASTAAAAGGSADLGSPRSSCAGSAEMKAAPQLPIHAVARTKSLQFGEASTRGNLAASPRGYPVQGSRSCRTSWVQSPMVEGASPAAWPPTPRNVAVPSPIGSARSSTTVRITSPARRAGAATPVAGFGASPAAHGGMAVRRVKTAGAVRHTSLTPEMAMQAHATAQAHAAAAAAGMSARSRAAAGAAAAPGAVVAVASLKERTQRRAQTAYVARPFR